MSIIPYTFPETKQDVRTVVIDGEPWFVGRDVASVLGYSNPSRDVARHTSDVQRRLYRIGTPSGEQDAVVLSEAGVYRLIMRSHLPAAERFQDWLAEDVIPSIRRTGRYEVVPQVPRTLPEALRAYAAEVEAREAAQARAAELEPAAAAWDSLASAEGDFSLREAAAILTRDPYITTGQNRLLASLRELGMVDAGGRPYARHVDAGRLRARVQSYTHPHSGEPTLGRPQIRVTVAGLLYVHRRLGGVAPLRIPTQLHLEDAA